MLAMDFERVLKALLQELDQRRIRYAALGGFALGALKVPRTTVDLDFLIHRDDLKSFHDSVSRLGYRLEVQTENVSHYRHTDPRWGGIDALHAFRSFSLAMLERSQSHPIFQGNLTVKVLQPEDVIGFKAQAMANNPLRATKEMVDIEALMAYYRQELDWTRIQEYFDLFELSEQGRQFRERFDHAE